MRLRGNEGRHFDRELTGWATAGLTLELDVASVKDGPALGTAGLLWLPDVVAVGLAGLPISAVHQHTSRSIKATSSGDGSRSGMRSGRASHWMPRFTKT